MSDKSIDHMSCLLNDDDDQFDVQYDDEMKYTVGIIPNRYGLQDIQEMAFICVKNC